MKGFNVRDGAMRGALVGAAAFALTLPFTGCVGGLPGRDLSGAGAGGSGNPPATAGTGGGTTASGSGGVPITGTDAGVMTGAAGNVGGTPGRTDGGAGTGMTSRGGASGSASVACGSSTGGGAGSVGTVPGRGPIFPPNARSAATLAVPPPAVSGGTLRVLSDGRTAVAADPDRDRVYVVDLTAKAVTATVMLKQGDEPGRVVEDAAGLVHVALRHAGAVVTFDPRQAQPTVTSQPVCASPRGLAYDAGADLIHVACADGELVSLPAGGGPAVRTLQLDRDLRDVVVSGSRLFVSRFRSAEVLTVDGDGTMSKRTTLPAFSSLAARGGQRFTPGAAWQMVATSDGGVAVLHQRGVSDTIRPTPGGYGGFNPCNSIVHTTVSTVAGDGSVKTGPVLAGLVLAVDMAISPDGKRAAFVSLGNATNQLMPTTVSSTPQLTRMFVADMTNVVDQSSGCRPDGTHAPCLPPSTTIVDPTTNMMINSTGCPPSTQVVGEPIAVAFAGDGAIVTQSREPAMLALADGSSISLSTDTRGDAGHFFFHANAGGFVACASCHLEGNDDGRVWNFDCNTATGAAIGPRRTQSLQTGLRGSEPFHWTGDESSFTQLMSDVFVTRMSGPKLPDASMDAMLTWIDAQPRPLRPAAPSTAAVQRGAALFNDATNVACVTCHSGARFSNNSTVDVGTGQMFQVPSLVGVGARGPFMHDGCAATLRDRFNPACGGDKHGITGQLSSGQIDDLIAYLNTL